MKIAATVLAFSPTPHAHPSQARRYNRRTIATFIVWRWPKMRKPNWKGKQRSSKIGMRKVMRRTNFLLQQQAAIALSVASETPCAGTQAQGPYAAMAEEVHRTLITLLDECNATIALATGTWQGNAGAITRVGRLIQTYFGHVVFPMRGTMTMAMASQIFQGHVFGGAASSDSQKPSSFQP